MQMREQDLMQLDTICRKCKVPLLIARSYGLVGYLRVGHKHSLCGIPCCMGLLVTHICIVHTPLKTSCGKQASLSEQTVIEAKPDNILEDLR